MIPFSQARSLSRAIAPLVAILFSVTARAFCSVPNSLADVLENVADSGHDRVALIAVGAEETDIIDSGDNRERLSALYPDDSAKLALDDVLPIFDRQRILCGSVQVIAPRTHVSINPEPAPAEQWAQIDREVAADKLFQSLNETQWDQATSPDGLGNSDLTSGEQRAWFRALIPVPFQLRQIAEVDQRTTNDISDDDPVQTIDPAQVHIRVDRTADIMLRSFNSKGDPFLRDTAAVTPHKMGERFWVTQASIDPNAVDTDQTRLNEAVRIIEPNRLKRTDLPFTSASLAGSRVRLTGAETVGELVRRIAEVSHLELYVDRRISGLSLTCIGPEDADADTGDLLKALCYAVAGTVRKIDDPARGMSVYLLTNDREGYMIRRLHLAEWAQDVQALQQGSEKAFAQSMKDGGYVHKITFGPGDPRAVSEDGMRAYEKWVSSPEYWLNNNGIPLSAFTPLEQSVIRRNIDEGKSQQTSINISGSNRTVAYDNKAVNALFSIDVTLVVPGYGSFPGPRLSTLTALLPTTPEPDDSPDGPTRNGNGIPAALKKLQALQIAATSPEEIEKVADRAQRHGFNALFLQIPPDSSVGSDKLLLTAVDSGRKHGLTVYPVVSLLRTTTPPTSDDSPTANPPEVEINVAGETLRSYVHRRKDAAEIQAGAETNPYGGGDWYDVGNANACETVTATLHHYGLFAGIAGIVLVDTAAPGRNLTDIHRVNSSLFGYYCGYDVTLRLKLIREQNVDPIDLSPYAQLQPFTFFPNDPGGIVPLFPESTQFPVNASLVPVYRLGKDGAWLTESPGDTGANPFDTREPETVWNRIRRDSNRESVGNIRHSAGLPHGLPVFVIPPPASWDPSAPAPWYASWPEDQPLLPLDAGDGSLANIRLKPEMDSAAMASALSHLPASPMYKGIVFDASTLPVDKALSLLDTVLP